MSIREFKSILPQFKLTSLDVPSLYRNSVGLDRMLNSIFNNVLPQQDVTFPPYNIIKTDDRTYRVEIAVVGFLEADIKITYDNNNLLISGEKQTSTPDIEYLHRGIAARIWERSFTLADYVTVKNATLADGLLTIELQQDLPDSLKPKTIPINSK